MDPMTIMMIVSAVGAAAKAATAPPAMPGKATAANTGPGFDSSGWTVNFGNGNNGASGNQLPQSPWVYAGLAVGAVVLWKLAKKSK